MPPVSGPELAALCGEADSETVTEFVADLYTARGYEVDRPAEGVLRLQPGGRTVAVRPTDSLPAAEVDAVVTAGTGPAEPTDSDEATGRIDIVDAETLHEHLVYAVDREFARELLGEHFGVRVDRGGSDERGGPVGAELADGSVLDGLASDRSTADTGRDEREGTSVDPRTWRRNEPRAVVAVTMAFLLVGVFAGGMLVLSPALGGTDDAASAETPSPTPAEAPTPADRNGEALAAGESSSERTPQRPTDESDGQSPGRYPPGVGAEGFTDIDTLIATHRSVLSNASFTTTIRYSEFEDGQVTGVYVESVRVESRDRYSVSVSSTGTLQTRPRAIVGADAFASENRTRVRLRSSEPYVRSRLSHSRMLGQLARYLRWSLSVEESTLRGQPTGDGGTYRITTDGDPYRGIRDASGTVYVTREGVVTYGQWTYTTVRPETRVEFSVETTGIGTTTVSQPGWPDADGEANETEARSN